MKKGTKTGPRVKFIGEDKGSKLQHLIENVARQYAKDNLAVSVKRPEVDDTDGVLTIVIDLGLTPQAEVIK